MISRTRILPLLIAVFAAVTAASDAGDYRSRLESAKAGVYQLAELYYNEHDEDAAVVDYLDELKRLVPSSESVKTNSGDIKTANQWFHETLASADAETDPAKRTQMLHSAAQRLGSMAEEIAKLTGAENKELSKDEQKRKLSEILNRQEYQKPTQSDDESLASQLVRRFLQWIESLFPNIGSSGSPSDASLASIGTVVKVVLVLAIVLLTLFILYKLLPVISRRFRKRDAEDTPERVILGERIGDDLSASDLFHEAESLARKGDLRGAIRKGYIAVLCELSDKKVIGLARHKTNRDYLRDVRGQRAVFREMTGITGSFEQHWYGARSADERDWEDFRQRCGKAIDAI